MKGMDLKTLTKKDMILLRDLFSINCFSRVKKRIIPRGSPIIKLNRPEANVMISVSQVPCINIQTVDSVMII